MRNKYFLQVPGSKVTHLPIDHEGGWRAACGLKWNEGNPWEGGYYETFPEITCKSCVKRIPKDAKFNRFTTPYKHAKVGEDGPMVFAHNLDELLTSGSIRENNPKCEYTWLPAKNGDTSGLLIEWYEALGMWTVWEFNPNAPHLRQYQVGYDSHKGSYGVFDKDTQAYVGHTASQSGAAVMARKMNNA